MLRRAWVGEGETGEIMQEPVGEGYGTDIGMGDPFGSLCALLSCRCLAKRASLAA